MAPPYSDWKTGGATSCDAGTGGGARTSHAACRQITDLSYCFDGRCVCPKGFTCPFCNLQKNYVEPGQWCPEVGTYTPPTPIPNGPATTNYYSWQAFTKYPTPAPGGGGEPGKDDDDDPASLVISGGPSCRGQPNAAAALVAATAAAAAALALRGV